MFEIINKCYKFDNGHTYKIMYSVELDDKKVFYLINVKDFLSVSKPFTKVSKTFSTIRHDESRRCCDQYKQAILPYNGSP